MSTANCQSQNIKGHRIFFYIRDNNINDNNGNNDRDMGYNNNETI